MAAKTLKINFSNFYEFLIDTKPIFMNSKSGSPMIGPPSFLMQTKIIW